MFLGAADASAAVRPCSSALCRRILIDRGMIEVLQSHFRDELERLHP
jgi:hypothetical protein